MYNHFKNISEALTCSSKESLKNNHFLFVEHTERFYGCIGKLERNGNIVILIFPETFYSYSREQPLNTHTLSLIFEIQKLDKEIPMQKVENSF